jgi:predicted MFS family arabinose efflux permease
MGGVAVVRRSYVNPEEPQRSAVPKIAVPKNAAPENTGPENAVPPDAAAHDVAATEPTRFPWWGLIVLASATFLTVTGETLPTGLLPDISSSLGVGEPAVGLLVTVFAFTVVVSSPPLAALTRRIPRHRVVIGVLVVLGLSTMLTSISPNYAFMVGTRVIGGVAHGLFWSVVGAYAGHLVPKHLIGRAVSITLGGGTLAFVFGVPLGTAMGHALGWRVAFGGLGVLMLAGALLLWFFLPRVEREVHPPRETDRAASWRGRLDPSLPRVLVICVIAAVTMIGHYTFYTYIAPFLIGPVGAAPASVGPLLFGYGLAGAVGLALAGSVLARRPRWGIVVGLIGVGVAVTVLALFAGQPVIALIAFFAWGVAFGVLPPLLQTDLLHTASARFRDTASAIYSSSFNVGIGGGALVGAVVFGAIGVRNLPWIYVGILVAVLIGLGINRMVERRAEPTAR